MTESELARFARDTQKEADRLQSQAAKAQRTADSARKAFKKRKKANEGK